MTSLPVRIVFGCLFGLASIQSAMAQYRDQLSRETVQAEWEKISAKELLCIDNRLRRARRSVNGLIDRGVSPSDSRAARIIRDCSAGASAEGSVVTPSFDCRSATFSDEHTICRNPELARLDRVVVSAYEEVLTRRGSRIAKNISGPLLEQRHACGTDFDCIRQTQLTAIAAFQAGGASVQSSATTDAARRDDPIYAIDKIRLGSSVTSNQDYREFDCSPSPQYAALSVCHRQTTERSRRRRSIVSTSLLHDTAGTAVYIEQNRGPVSIGYEDAEDEIARLSETFGKPTVLPMSDSRGVRRGVIAAWGGVSLHPVEQDRLAALADGIDNKPGILIDHLKNPKQAAKAGLPVYRLDGGPGYVWAANWTGRARALVRIIAIDASRLSGAVAAPAIPAWQNQAAAKTPENPVDSTGAPQGIPTQPITKPPVSTPVAPSSQPATVPGSQADIAPLVRVVGPPIELRPVIEVKSGTTAGPRTDTRDGSGWLIVLATLSVALLSAVAFSYRNWIAATPVAGVAAFANEVPTSAPVTFEAQSTSPATGSPSASEQINLPALIPAESLGSIAASPQDMIAQLDTLPEESTHKRIEAIPLSLPVTKI